MKNVRTIESLLDAAETQAHLAANASDDETAIRHIQIMGAYSALAETMARISVSLRNGDGATGS